MLHSRFAIAIAAALLCACGGGGSLTPLAAATPLPEAAPLPSCDTTYTTNLRGGPTGGYATFLPSSWGFEYMYFGNVDYVGQDGDDGVFQLGTLTCFNGLPGPAKANETIVQAWSIVSSSSQRGQFNGMSMYGSYPKGALGGKNIGIEVYRDGLLEANAGGEIVYDTFTTDMVPLIFFPNQPVYIELVERS